MPPAAAPMAAPAVAPARVRLTALGPEPRLAHELRVTASNVVENAFFIGRTPHTRPAAPGAEARKRLNRSAAGRSVSAQYQELNQGESPSRHIVSLWISLASESRGA